MSRAWVKFMQVVWSQKPILLFIHITWHVEEGLIWHQEWVQCCDCWWSLRIDCRTEVGSLCPFVYRVLEQLGFCMDGNANLHSEFTECYHPLNQVWQLAAELTYRDSQCGFSYLLHIVRSTHRMRTSLRFTILLSFTDPFWCHFDTHNGTALQLGASCVWNWSRKPCCVAVIGSVLMNSFTATMWCLTDQRSISSKLKRAFYTTNVSMEALCIRKDDNYIEKTIRYFWHTCTHIYKIMTT